MPFFKLPDDSFFRHKTGTAIKLAAFETFNPQVLGIGDVTIESTVTPAIAAIFDLQGFTVFCKQIEPHLSVPIYLNGFLNWIFAEIRNQTIRKKVRGGVTTWHALPFFTKFMGDGLLVMWDTTHMSRTAQHNLITSSQNLLESYHDEFVPRIAKKVSDVPPLLRCGIAKGTVFSVGDGNDYVGSCINVAARLQKLPGLTMAFARRGFDPELQWKGLWMVENWLLKKTSIRGIGGNELVYVLKTEYEALSAPEKGFLLDP